MDIFEIITIEDAKEWVKERAESKSLGKWLFYVIAALLVMAEYSQL